MHRPRRSALVPAPLNWQRPFWITLAWVALGLALLGVVLPGLPTTPFVLLSAWAASRGSPRLHAWLLAHRLFGPMIVDWQTSGAVHRRAKWLATWMMLACAVLLWWLSPKPWAAALGCAVMFAVGTWLWMRPEPDRPCVTQQTPD